MKPVVPMRTTNAAGRNGNFSFGFENDPIFAERAESPDQLAVVWTSADEMVTAYPVPDVGTDETRLRIVRFPSDVDLAATVSRRRSKETGLPSLSDRTHYLTSVSDYSELTRVLALDGERLAYPDAVLLDWLINAEKEMLPGTDRHPVFDTALDDTACTIRRLPNGRIAITEASRQHVQSLGTRMRAVVGERPNAQLSITVETPVRSAARYFLTETNIGARLLGPGSPEEITAFLMINKSGYSFGSWSPAAGLFSEYAFLAPDALNRGARKRKEDIPAAKVSGRATDDTPVEEYVRHAFDQLIQQISPERREDRPPTDFARVVWAAERGIEDVSELVAAECSARTGLEFISIGTAAEDAIAGGLLLGSYSFGGASVEGAETLPPVDLARDILVLADTEEIERRHQDEVRQAKRRSKAAMTALAVPMVVVAVILAFAAELAFSHLITLRREAAADARTLELKPAVERRRSYEANLKWYKEFITEVSQLRRQQPVGIGLLYQLDPNYPFNSDPTFYVSEMKLGPAGDVEIKGLARNKDAIASFLKSLEYASGPESGSRLFSNLAYEVQETTQPQNTTVQSRPVTPAGSTLNTAAAAPGVVVWSIKGNYLPMAEFAPKPAQPGQPAAPGQAPTARNQAEPQQNSGLKPAG